MMLMREHPVIIRYLIHSFLTFKIISFKLKYKIIIDSLENLPEKIFL